MVLYMHHKSTFPSQSMAHSSLTVCGIYASQSLPSISNIWLRNTWCYTCITNLPFLLSAWITNCCFTKSTFLFRPWFTNCFWYIHISKILLPVQSVLHWLLVIHIHRKVNLSFAFHGSFRVCGIFPFQSQCFISHLLHRNSLWYKCITAFTLPFQSMAY